MSRGLDTPFGVRLRRLREAASLTQEELAKRAGLTARGISDLERGARNRPYPHTVRSLADALELPEKERASLFAAVPKRRGVPTKEGKDGFVRKGKRVGERTIQRRMEVREHARRRTVAAASIGERTARKEKAR